MSRGAGTPAPPGIPWDWACWACGRGLFNRPGVTRSLSTAALALRVPTSGAGRGRGAHLPRLPRLLRRLPPPHSVCRPGGGRTRDQGPSSHFAPRLVSLTLGRDWRSFGESGQTGQWPCSSGISRGPRFLRGPSSSRASSEYASSTCSEHNSESGEGCPQDVAVGL